MTATYNLTEYALSEEHFANLASEFMGRAQFPAGDHAEAVVDFKSERDYTERELAEALHHAMQPFKLKK
jgi:hypothetical protein